MTFHEFCHTYEDPDDFEDCVRYFYEHIGTFPRRPPIPPIPPAPPPFPPRNHIVVVDYQQHHHINYVIMSTVIIVLIITCVLLLTALFYKYYPFPCRRQRPNNQTENNEIPMVTIVIHPDESTNLAQ